MSVGVYAQNITVKGHVKDALGGVIGANVVEKGNTTNGTITDLDGNFTLTVPAGAILQISFIGYNTQEVTVGEQTSFNVVLKEDTETLEEVVVVGYGVQKKKLVTGATVEVKGDDVAKRNTISALGALQNQSPGVNIQATSGKPGDGYKISIRGAGTNSSTNPLYIIDGVAGGDINALNPADIERIDVLKDASSTAIYGSRGSNGVVLVTTKTGLAGATQVTLDASFGVANVYKRYDLLNSREYAQALVDAGKKTQDEMSVYLNGTNPGIDWQDEIFRTGITQNYKVAVSSGNDKTQFYLSGNYMGQTGVVIESKNERYQAKANVTSQVTPWLHVTADVNASHNIRKGGSFATGKDNPNLDCHELFSYYADDGW